MFAESAYKEIFIIKQPRWCFMLKNWKILACSKRTFHRREMDCEGDVFFMIN